MTENADFKIAYDGTWYHDGAPIKREALAKLFADKALKRDEEGRYWLQTPFEKYPVEVEDVPFVIVDYFYEGGVLTLKSNMEERVEVGPDCPITLRKDQKSGDILPYVEIRNALYARLSRSVYYNLVNAYGESVTSHGAEFKLGEMNAA